MDAEELEEVNTKTENEDVPVNADPKELRKGDYILHNSKVFKIMNYETAKTGKHGAAKVMIKGINHFSSKEGNIEISFQGGQKVERVFLKMFDREIVNAEEDYFEVIDEKLNLISIKYPDQEGKNMVQENFKQAQDKDKLALIKYETWRDFFRIVGIVLKDSNETN